MENQQWEKPGWEAAGQHSPKIQGFSSSLVSQSENLGWSGPNSQEGTETLSQEAPGADLGWDGIGWDGMSCR